MASSMAASASKNRNNEEKSTQIYLYDDMISSVSDSPKAPLLPLIDTKAQSNYDSLHPRTRHQRLNQFRTWWRAHLIHVILSLCLAGSFFFTDLTSHFSSLAKYRSVDRLGQPLDLSISDVGVQRNPAFLIKARHGAVATENHNCSLIGVDVLKDGGNAVDAAIAATLCIGVANLFS